MFIYVYLKYFVNNDLYPKYILFYTFQYFYQINDKDTIPSQLKIETMGIQVEYIDVITMKDKVKLIQYRF